MPPISAATGRTLGTHFALGVEITTPVALATYSIQEVQSIVKIADIMDAAKECPNLLDNTITLKCLWMHTVLLSVPYRSDPTLQETPQPPTGQCTYGGNADRRQRRRRGRVKGRFQGFHQQ